MAINKAVAKKRECNFKQNSRNEEWRRDTKGSPLCRAGFVR